MQSHRADVIATVFLFPTDAGGRSGPTPASTFNCLTVIDEINFDVRLHLEETGAISPGQTVQVPISFLTPEQARQYCSVGKEFLLREISLIGKGKIEAVVF